MTLANLKYSTRSLSRQPGLTVALVTSIATGIGANAVVYGFVRGLVASTLQQPDKEISPEIVASLQSVATLLQLAAAAVLFVACANVSAFLLARVWARARETSVRVALGASRTQLAAQLLSDSVVIGIAGCAAGLILAQWTSQILPVLFYSEDAEQLVFAPDLTAIALTAGLGVLITIVFGLLPILDVRDDRPALVLQRESAGPSRLARRLHTGLVVTQMTCCCVLVISAGLLLQSLRAALQTSAAHRLGNPIVATLWVRPESPSAHEATRLGVNYFREAERAARDVLGITSTAWVGTLPGSAATVRLMQIERPELPRREISMDVAAFTPATLNAVVVPPAAGRLFAAHDTADSCRVGVINQAAADLFFGGQAVGRNVEDGGGQRLSIIGVLTMRSESAAARRPTMFLYPVQGGPISQDRTDARFTTATTDGGTVTLESNVVSRSFFDMMGIAARGGTLFTDEADPDSCAVGVVNVEAAERYFNGNAVGGAVIDANGTRTEIVGVVDVPQLQSLERPIEPTIFLSMAQHFLPRMVLLATTPHPDRQTVATSGRALDAVPGAFRPPNVKTMDTHLAETALAPRRIATTLTAASAIMAIGLGIVGLSGALLESSRQRRRETALRIALGSPAWRIRRAVFAEGVRFAAGGIALGLAAASSAARGLATIAPLGGSATITVWLTAPLLLFAVVAIAGLVPARRAIMANPLQAIRGDH